MNSYSLLHLYLRAIVRLASVSLLSICSHCMPCSRFLLFHSGMRLYLLSIFFIILPLVFIFSLPQNGLCALKSPSSIIGARSCSGKSLISFLVTWSFGGSYISILFFFFSQPGKLPVLPHK